MIKITSLKYWIISILAVFLLFLLTSVFVIYFLAEDSRKDNISHYKFLRVNTAKNESSVGFVSMSRQLESAKDTSQLFISNIEESEYFLISENELQDEEYLCVGSCYCEDDEMNSNEEVSRRATVSLVQRGIIFLVSALSSAVAYNSAKEYFENDCNERLALSCKEKSSSIKSEVVSCGEIPTPNINLKRKYFCKGNCLPKRFKREQTRQLAIDYGCDDISVEAEVVVKFIHYNKRQKVYKSGGHGNYLALKHFQSKYLKPHCKLNSRERYWYQPPVSGKAKWIEVNLCCGSHTGKGGWNPSVHCRQSSYESDWVDRWGKGRSKYWDA